MFIKNYGLQEVKNSKRIKRICDICNNECEHILVDEPSGLFIGLPFAKRPWLSSSKHFYLQCTICGKPNKILTKDEAKSLMNK